MSSKVATLILLALLLFSAGLIVRCSLNQCDALVRRARSLL